MSLLPRSGAARVLLALAAVVLTIVIVLIASTGWLDALGKAPSGERLARIRQSPNYRDRAFRNPEETNLATSGSTWQSIRQWLGGHEQRVPPGSLPMVRLTRADFDNPPASGLRATWLGHSTVLVEIDGARVLFDPVWARRASPSSLVGPKRFHQPPLALEELPPLDAIIASHDLLRSP